MSGSVPTRRQTSDRPLARIVAPLRRSSGFRRLWLSSICFFSGYWAQMVILGWLAFDLTRSEFSVALFGAVGFAPFFLGPVGGLIADHVNRPRLIMLSQIIGLAVGIAIALLVMCDRVEFWHVVLVGFLNGMTQAPLQPARYTLIMDQVGRETLSSANALNMASLLGGRIAAPALAGVLIAGFGADVALWSAAAWYVPAILFLWPVREARQQSGSGQWQLVGDLLDGFRVFVRDPGLRVILIATVAANLLAWSIVQSFLPIFAEDVLEVGATGLGVIVAVNGLGALAGAIVIAAMGDFTWKGWMFLGATACFGTSLALFAVSGTYALALVAILLAGFTSAGFGVLQSTLALLLAPEHARGRVAGVMMFSIGVMPLGMLVQGAIATVVGVVVATVVSGMLLTLVTILLAATSPGLRRI